MKFLRSLVYFLSIATALLPVVFAQNVSVSENVTIEAGKSLTLRSTSNALTSWW